MFEYQDDLKAVFKATCIVGYTTSVSVVIYGVIAVAIVSSSSSMEPVFGDTTLIRQIFWAMALAVLVSIVWIKRVVFHNKNKQLSNVSLIIKKLQKGSMLTFGLCESIGVLGLILTLLTKSVSDYYGHGFLSLFAFGVFFPKYQLWDRYVRESIYSADFSESL